MIDAKDNAGTGGLGKVERNTEEIDAAAQGGDGLAGDEMEEIGLFAAWDKQCGRQYSGGEVSGKE